VSRNVRLTILEIMVPVILVAAIWMWTAAADSFFFPPLAAVLRAFQRLWFGAAFLNDALPSLGRWWLAYLIAVIGGIAIGVPMGLSERVRNLLWPVFDFIRATPPPAILPIAVITLGIDDLMKISIIVLVSIFPVIISTADGLAEVHPTMRDVARSYRLPFHALLFRVMLPAAAPRILAGLRTSCSLALVMIVLSEMFGSTNGLGFRILMSLRSFSIADMWAGVILIGLLGYGVNVVFEVVQRRLVWWHQAQ
jgi:ABC-type nitrate/sulfonate/bicarbonate transport system permease component